MSKKALWTISSMLLVAAAFTSQVKADEVSELKKMLAEQSLMMKQLEQRLAGLEAQQEQQKQFVQQEMTKISETHATAQIPDSLKWATKMKFSGDFRYRHETIEEENNNTRDRHRNRIRARLGLKAEINDEWTFGLRIATGGNDPVSTNQTLGDGFSSKNIALDQAYAQWKPADTSLTMIFGKFGNPFYKPEGSQLIWDGDLSMEGIAATYDLKFSDTLSGWVTGGGLWVDESGGNTDAALFGIQAGLKAMLDEKDTYILAGGGYFAYDDLNGRLTIYDDTDSFGNSSNTVGGQEFYIMDYHIAEFFAEMGMKIAGMPSAIYFDYAQNTEATTSDDTGWLIGARLNKAKKPGSWQVTYNYRDLERDAVLGVFSDSDFIGGGTNGKGHQFGFKYAIADNFYAGINYFLNEKGNAENDYRRLQLDLEYKF